MEQPNGVNMKNILPILIIAVAAMVSGCQSEETRSVEWYRAPENKVAFEAKLAECKNNPGELKNTPNCVNAFKAFELNFLKGGKFEKVREPEFGFGKK